MKAELHLKTKQGEPVDIVVKYTLQKDKEKIENLLQEIKNEIEEAIQE